MNNTKQLEKKINKEFKTGNVKSAIELCQLGLQEDPTNGALHLRLGDLYLAWHLDISNSSQYIDEAITEYQRASESYVDSAGIHSESCVNSAEIHFKIGQAYYFKGDLDKAINYFDAALEKDSKMSKAYYLLSETYTKKARFFEAVLNAQKSVKTAPFRNSSAHYLLSNLYSISSFQSPKLWLKSKFEYVLSLLTLPFDIRALKNVCQQLSYLRFIPTWLKGIFYANTKGIEDAIQVYIDAIDKAPGFIPFYGLLGDVYCTLGRYEDAITEYKMAIWLDCLNIQAYRHLAAAYEELGDYDNAVEIYEKLVKIMPTMPDIHTNLANILFVKGDIDGAISHFQAAITLNPKKEWASVVNQTLGFIFQETKQDLDAAITAYQSAYVETPKDIDIYVNLGSAFYDKEDFTNALAVYRTALDFQPKNAQIHCNLGFLYWGNGNIDEAIKEYELAIEYNPYYDIAYNNLAVIYLDDLGQVRKAIELFEKSIECNANYALAQFNMARAIAITGDKIEAAKLYQNAQNINNVTNEMDPQEIIDKINGLFN